MGDKRFASDPLLFTGADMSSSTKLRRGYSYDDAEGSSDDSADSDYHEGGDKQLAIRGDKEEILVQNALDRIRRAQEKGKQDVKLSQEELDALERRRKRMQEAAASKSKKGHGTSGSGADKKRRSDRKTVNIASLVDPRPEPRKRKSKRKSDENSRTPAGPGIVASGPDGPIYAPIGGYYPPTTRGSSRSKSRGSPPPGTSRHFSDGMRPSSNSPRRHLVDDDGWAPTASNKRTSLNLNSQYRVADPFDYQVSADQPPPIPTQYMQPTTGRRNYSGPPDVSYSSVQRSPPQGYPAPARAPSVRYRTSTQAGVEVIEIQDSSSEESDSSDELGNGVQVSAEEREPEPVRVSRKPVGGRKKGKGR